MILSTTRKRSASKPPSAMELLIAQAENAAFRHLTAENAMLKGDNSRRADFVAYCHERDAINERASFMLSESAFGAAFQLALAVSDAELLCGNELESKVMEREITHRMKRLFARVMEYLEGQGNRLPGTFADYYAVRRLDK